MKKSEGTVIRRLEQEMLKDPSVGLVISDRYLTTSIHEKTGRGYGPFIRLYGNFNKPYKDELSRL